MKTKTLSTLIITCGTLIAGCGENTPPIDPLTVDVSGMYEVDRENSQTFLKLYKKDVNELEKLKLEVGALSDEKLAGVIKNSPPIIWVETEDENGVTKTELAPDETILSYIKENAMRATAGWSDLEIMGDKFKNPFGGDEVCTIKQRNAYDGITGDGWSCEGRLKVSGTTKNDLVIELTLRNGDGTFRLKSEK